MTEFKYTAETSTGEIIRNSIQAESREQASAIISSMGFKLKSLDEKTTFTFKNPFKKVKHKQLAIAMRQMYTMIKASIPIPVMLEVMYEDEKKGYFKDVLCDVKDAVMSGIPMSEAFGKFPDVFSEFIINMIEVGETNGHLDVSFERIASSVEKTNKTVGKVKSALAYPTVVVVVAIFMVIFLSVRVIPTFATLFEDMGSELPTITKVMLAISDFMVGYWWLVILIMIGIVVLFTFLWRKKDSRRVMQKIILKIPVIGKLQISTIMAKFSRTMSSMIDGGVSIMKALEITQGSVGNEVYFDCFTEIISNIKNGEPIYSSLQSTNRFTNLMVSMTKIGEESGKLGELLTNTAELYEDDVDRKVTAAMALIEPLITIILGIVVALIVCSIVVPMFDMYSLIGT